MSERKKFTRIVTPVGVAVYPHLTTPDTKFDQNGVYHTKLRIREDEAADLIAQLEKIRDEAFAELEPVKRKKLTLADVVEREIDPETGDETGYVIIKAKLKARVFTKTGNTWEQQPRFWDAENNELSIAELNIWGGSKLRLSCEVIPYEMQSTKQFGVSLRLRQVQVIELVEGGNGGQSPFEKTEGFTKPKSGVTEVASDEDDDGSVDF